MTYSALGTYQETEVQSLTPGGRVVFIYKHLLGKLEHARQSSEIEDYQTALQGAQDTISELLGSLNMDAGGEIAGNLCSLYSFFLRELIALGGKRDDMRMQQLVEQISSMKTAWEAAAIQPQSRELSQ